MCTHHFLTPDDWASTNWGTVETALRDAYQAPSPQARASNVSLRELRWYRGAPDADEFESVHRISSGLAWAAGTSPPLPPQVACTVTEITDRRRSWGRFYLPTVGVNNIGAGRLLSDAPAAIALAWKNAYDAISATGMEPVVKTKATWPWDLYPFALAFRIRVGVPETSRNRYLPIKSVRVDDILDVMRSRRFEAIGVRATQNLINRGA